MNPPSLGGILPSQCEEQKVAYNVVKYVLDKNEWLLVLERTLATDFAQLFGIGRTNQEEMVGEPYHFVIPGILR